MTFSSGWSLLIWFVARFTQWKPFFRQILFFYHLLPFLEIKCTRTNSQKYANIVFFFLIQIQLRIFVVKYIWMNFYESQFKSYLRWHSLHWYGFSPEWILRCLVKVLESEKAFLQRRHLYHGMKILSKYFPFQKRGKTWAAHLKINWSWLLLRPGI